MSGGATAASALKAPVLQRFHQAVTARTYRAGRRHSGRAPRHRLADGGLRTVMHQRPSLGEDIVLSGPGGEPSKRAPSAFLRRLPGMRGTFPRPDSVTRGAICARAALLVGTLACLVGLTVSPAASATASIRAGAGPVATVGADAVLFSRPVKGRYRLSEQRDGRIRSLPVASRDVPFDVDTGRDRSGHTVAVYSRCRISPGPGGNGDGNLQPSWRAGSAAACGSST